LFFFSISILCFFLGAYKTGDIAHVLTEYLEGGDLRRLLLDSSTALGWKFRTEIALGFAQAISYLHSLEIIHRDIKTENVLLNSKGEPKLCDFGFARQWDKSKTMTMCGTDEFMAPEIIFSTPYDEKIDVYSFGITLAEIIVRKQPGKSTGFLDRGPQHGFQVDHEELDRECTAVTAPTSLVLLTKECCAQELDSRLAAVDVVRWLEDLLKETEPDTIPVPGLGGDAIKDKLEQYLKRTDMADAKEGEEDDDDDKPISSPGGHSAALTDRNNNNNNNTDGQRGDRKTMGGAGSGGGGGNTGGTTSGNQQHTNSRRSSSGGFSLLGCLGIGGSGDKIKRAGDKTLRMQGWVIKRGGRIKTWKKRYMVISNVGIVYYKAPDDKEEQGQITFGEMTTVAGVVANAVPTVMTGKPNTFGVHTQNRTYYISASSVEERGKWIRAISDGYRSYLDKGGAANVVNNNTGGAKRKGSD
jgi:hypothetical protein